MKRVPKANRKPQHDWYDAECKALRGSIRSGRRKLTKNPFCADTRARYLNSCRDYKRLLKSKERKYKDELISRLSSLATENPNRFWKALKTMRGPRDDSYLGEDIKAGSWQRHFEDLGTSKADPNSCDKNLIDELKLLEKRSQVKSKAILDDPITIREIKEVVKHLKNNKANGEDLITHEMLKYGAPVLLPALAKLFNPVLQIATFPREWNISFKVPIYKKGDPTNCDNYRGIGITSGLALGGAKR